MTKTETHTPHHNPQPSQGTFVLVNLGFSAVAIVGAIIGYIIHAWRTPGEPATPQSQLKLAEKAFQNGNNQAALMAFTSLAGENNPLAEYWLGHMTEFGLGVPRDPASVALPRTSE